MTDPHEIAEIIAMTRCEWRLSALTTCQRPAKVETVFAIGNLKLCQEHADKLHVETRPIK